MGNPTQAEAMNNVKSFIANHFEGAFVVEERAVSMAYDLFVLSYENRSHLNEVNRCCIYNSILYDLS